MTLLRPLIASTVLLSRIMFGFLIWEQQARGGMFSGLGMDFMSALTRKLKKE